jgi:subfamily B ATP-binding cassette protein MsbA
VAGRQRRQVTVGGFAAFITAMLMLVAPLKHLSDVMAPITARGWRALERGIELIENSPRSAAAATRPSADGRAQGAIELRNVVAALPQRRRRPALDG